MENFNNNPNQEVLNIMLKRRNIYTIIFAVLLVLGGVSGIIPVVGWYISTAALILSGIFAGFGMFCINNYRIQKSNGAKEGGGLWWWGLFICGLIVIPVLTVFILRHVTALAEKILGVEVIRWMNTKQ